MIEHYSYKIQNVIQKELFKAKNSIKIAVAWFTNDLLFQPLLLKLQTGVSVELILNKDEINDSEKNDVDFNEFIEQGGILHWNTSNKLMHEKFCIIDDKVVIFGSYNWTNKAEFNDESIAVSKEEVGTVDFYNQQFNKLSRTYIPITKRIETKKEEVGENLKTQELQDAHQIKELSSLDIPKEQKSEEHGYEQLKPSVLRYYNSKRKLIYLELLKKKSSRKKNKEFGKEIEELKKLADKGDPISALYVGACYKYGIFFKRDKDCANKYFEISSKGANTEAMMEMVFDFGNHYDGNNMSKCEELLNDASELGCVLAKEIKPKYLYYPLH